MNTIQSEYEVFKPTSLAAQASPELEFEVRKAFYIGAGSMLNLSAKLPKSDAVANAIIKGWLEELGMFTEEIKASKKS